METSCPSRTSTKTISLLSKDRSTIRRRNPRCVRTASPAKIASGAKSDICFLVSRPGRHDAGDPGIRNQLSHVLIGVNDDPEIHSLDGCISVFDMNFALKILGLCR